MKIIAYKCPDTGEIFESKLVYDSHRKRFLAEKRRRREREKMLQGLDKNIIKLRETAKSAYDIERWILLNSNLLMHRNCVINCRKKTKFEFDKVCICIAYEDQLSNSHSAPFGGVENWSREQDMPLYYPGWRGRIDLYFTGDVDGFLTEMFDNTGINLGSGSGGHASYHSELTLWEADWPGLKEQRVFDMLGK